MANEEKKDDDLKIVEQQDGSVLVGGAAPKAKEDEDDHSESAGALASGEDDERLTQNNDAHEEEQAAEGETEEEAEARRQRNRKRRAENKQNRKDYIESLRREIAARDEMLQQQEARLAAVERRTNGADMAMVDQELQKAAEAYNYYKAVHADAVTNAKGQDAVEAQEKMFAAMRRAEELTRIREASKRPQQQVQPLDPRLKMHAEDWSGRNNWYDPDLKDTDSRIANTVDQELAKEGWNPTTPQYWEELDSRLKKYLPHRYNSGHNSRQGTKPRVPVAGSGRESSATASSGYVLSPGRVQALKDAGMWDDPMQRAKMIKRYQEQDKQEGAR